MDRKVVLDKLSKLISFQSISYDKKKFPEILKTVDFIQKELIDLGFQINLYQNKNCPPLIIGKKIVSTKKRTIGFYAHYDVQSDDPVKKWNTPPFKLTVINGKLYGRGVADDKGHLMQIIESARKIIKENNQKNNLVFIFEGEEEVGSENFEELIKKDRFLKEIDVFYIFDMGMRGKNIPQIFYGLRGLVGFELIVKIGESDLHSGVYGNRVLNPISVLADLIVKMKDPHSQKILISGFYDRVKKILEKEKKLLLRIPYNNIEELKEAKVYNFIGSPIKAKTEPSLEINNIEYPGKGFKTIIPSEATIKFTIRLVRNQKTNEIINITEKFIKNTLPPQVKFNLKSFNGGEFFYTDFNNVYSKKTASILSSVFNHETYFNCSGGSVGAAEIILRIFKQPVILTGFTLPDENIHAPNENFDEEMFFKGMVAIEKIMLQ